MFGIRTTYKYEVFLSHAHEDKDGIANELNAKLRAAGVKVWYSGTDLKLGEDLDETILKKVIPRSKYGVVVLSEDYFVADWGRTELNHLYSFEPARNYRVILPVWHGVDENRIKVQFPYLVGRFALRSDHGVDKIVHSIVAKLGEKQELITEVPPPPIHHLTNQVSAWLAHYWLECLALIGVCALAVGLWLHQDALLALFRQEPVFIDAIENRIARFSSYADEKYVNWSYTTSPKPCDFDEIRTKRLAFTAKMRECAAPSYQLFSLFSSVNGKRQVEQAGFSKEFFSAYGMANYRCVMDTSESDLRYALFNEKPVSYQIREILNTEDHTQAIVKVSYAENLKWVLATLKRKKGASCATEDVLFYGLKPEEEYVFEQKQGTWKFIAVK